MQEAYEEVFLRVKAKTWMPVTSDPSESAALKTDRMFL